MILAAGEARRMGVAKPALAYGSGSMVSTVVDSARAAGLSPIVVVTGFHAQEVAGAVADSAIVVHNPEAGAGNITSLIAGLDALPDSEGVIVLLADMPGIHRDVIADLAQGVAELGTAAGWVEYANGRGHPVALARSTFEEVRGLTGARPLWPFLSSLASEAVFVLRVAAPRPIDVNTPADYTRAANTRTQG